MTKRRTRLWLALGVAIGIATAAWWFARGGSRTDPFAAGRPLIVIASGDTSGWIIPCGCTSNQSGGLLRRASYVAGARERGDVVLVDAGGAPGGASEYERIRFEAIGRGEVRMGIAAHNVGGPEARLGAPFLRRLARETGLPLLSANVRDAEGNLVADPIRIVEAGGWRVAIIGVLSPRYAAADRAIEDPVRAVLETAALAKGRYDRLVVLAYLPEPELRTLAGQLPEADLVLGGPTGQTIRPARVGPTVVAAATNKGKFLVELRLEEDAAAGWVGSTVEMGPSWQNHPEQKENLRAFHARLGELDLPATATGFAPPLPARLPGDYQVAGSESCLACHESDCKVWTDSGHAHAWASLQADGYEVDSHCQQCHTTGFGLPGGFLSARRSASRVSVGCESCHGPSLAHVQRPRTPTPFAARDQCIRCHDPENSPEFAYDEYWPQIVHGSTDVKQETPE